jgi:hypothetical protein
LKTLPADEQDAIAARLLAEMEDEQRQQVAEGNHSKIVAIALETGDFEVDSSEVAASMLQSGLYGLVAAMSVVLAVASANLHDYGSC